MEKIRVENFEDIHTHIHTCNLKKKGKNEKAITLIALVIAIAILIILAGVVIVALGGENGLLTQGEQEKQAQTESERMRETLRLALEDLQRKNATLDDVTQEWIDEQIEDYKCIIKDYESVEQIVIDGSKRIDVVYTKKVLMCNKKEYNSEVYEFGINKELYIFDIRDKILKYSVDERKNNIVKLTMEIKKFLSGYIVGDIQTRVCAMEMKLPDGSVVKLNDLNSIRFPDDSTESLEFQGEIGKEYNFEITLRCYGVSTGNILSSYVEFKQYETVYINSGYFGITKDLGDGISIDNEEVEVEWYGQYSATITVDHGYIIDEIEVKMNGDTIGNGKYVIDEKVVSNIEKKDSDKKVIIYIACVDGDIEITAKRKKLEIKATEFKKPDSGGSSEDKIKLGEETFIEFEATLEGNKCKIEPNVPYRSISKWEI